MSIAVLPFTNIVAGTEQDTAYFSDGVSEEILNALSKVEGLRVAARTSSFAFRENDVREVGETLNVSVVLKGSVRRAGDQLRISAQLVDLDEKYPDRLTGALTLSRVWERSGNNLKALDIARQAVELAPTSPMALATLVETNTRLGNFDQARAALVLMNGYASNNETAIITTMRFYLMTGDFEFLERLTAKRVANFVDNEGMVGTEIHVDRVAWAATARLALGDVEGARDLFEKGIPDPISTNSQSLGLYQSIRSSARSLVTLTL